MHFINNKTADECVFSAEKYFPDFEKRKIARLI